MTIETLNLSVPDYDTFTDLVGRCADDLRSWLARHPHADADTALRECVAIVGRWAPSGGIECAYLLRDEFPAVLTEEMPAWAWEHPRWGEGDTPTAAHVLAAVLEDRLLAALADTCARLLDRDIDIDLLALRS
jgi:hypothetical protein